MKRLPWTKTARVFLGVGRPVWITLLFLSATAYSQETGSLKERVKTAPKTLRHSAEEILSKAAEVQGGKEIAAHLKNFKAKFESTYFDPEKARVIYDVTRVFMFPSYIWTEKKHGMNKKPSIQGFDGQDGWIIMPNGKLVVYTDKPATFKTDMENLERDARLTKEMFRYFFIANLRDQVKELSRKSDKPVPRSNKIDPAFVIEGKTTGWIDKNKTVRLKIYVDQKTYQVKAVQMDDLGSSRRRLFLFDLYHKNRQGVLVPVSVKMFSGNDPEPEISIDMDFAKGKDKEGKDILYPLIDFNLDIDFKLFAIPDEKEEGGLKSPGV